MSGFEDSTTTTTTTTGRRTRSCRTADKLAGWCRWDGPGEAETDTDTDTHKVARARSDGGRAERQVCEQCGADGTRIHEDVSEVWTDGRATIRIPARGNAVLPPPSLSCIGWRTVRRSHGWIHHRPQAPPLRDLRRARCSGHRSVDGRVAEDTDPPSRSIPVPF